MRGAPSQTQRPADIVKSCEAGSCTERSQSVNLSPMPFISSKAKHLTTKAKVLKVLLPATSYLLLATIFFGCSAIGTTKPAALQITSIPEASVFLDGKHLGKTPFFSDQLKVGEYLLKITAGEASFVEKITLSGGTLTVVNRELANNFLAESCETLWLESGKRGLFVSSMPSEVEITMDGKLVGKTPYLVEKLEEGEHKITLTKAGYINREFAVKASNKYQVVADVTLASEIAKNPQVQPSPVPALSVQKVRILATPTGFLRVRKEASLDSPEIGRVKTGDELEIIQETKDWVKVKFEDKQGWISSQYAKKLP